ncbi:mechanosensitive channel MscK [Larsenimonas suaedae]|uniref:Mechanosensitive channel MscK n=1 Tax=Larsenimonas suaedae TaxID=1851019 RepID=A0ABU1GZC5_9GAMM|nr:mechanosensitive channel MscK [Larsenimonas suaedae]MCM2972783.1 mechanosensitive channel MscK [Larsenimonas suaedae]MDR5896882.1 mechanosensitive channel MscK [Larsenimonas suaedae]
MSLCRAIMMMTAIVVLVLSGTRASLAEAAQALPERSTVEQQLEKLTDKASPTADERERIEQLQATRDDLLALSDIKDQFNQIERRVTTAAEREQRYRRALDSLGANDVDRDGLASRSLDELAQRAEKAVDELKSHQSTLADINRALINAQTLPERAQSTISQAQAELQSIETSRQGRSRDGEQGADDLKRQAQQVRQVLLETRIRYKRYQLEHNTQLRDTAQAQRELLARQIEQLNNRLLVLQSLINQKRRDQSEQAIVDATRTEGDARMDSPIIDAARARNRELSQQLLTTTDRVNTLIRESIEASTELDRVRQVQRTLNEQIEAVRGSLLLSKLLRQQRNTLDDVDIERGLNEEIGQVRLKQFDLAQTRDQLSNLDTYLAEQLKKADATNTPAELKQSLRELYQARRDVVDQLDREYGNLLGRAIDLQLSQQQLIAISKSVRQTIQEQLFWAANGQPLGLNWLAGLPSAVWQDAVDPEWMDAMKSLWQRPSANAWFMVLPLGLALTLAFFRRRIKARLLVLHNEVGRLKRDSQLHTPKAISMNWVLSSTGPLLMGSLGGGLFYGGQGLAQSLGEAFLRLALAWGVFGLMRRLLVRDGVAERHFHWAPGYVALLRRYLLWLGIALVPVILITTLAERAESLLAEHPLALIVLIGGFIGMSVYMARVVLAHTPYMGVRLFRLLLGLSLACVPLALTVLVCLGYEYTALRLCGRFINTLYIFALWIVVEASVVRGLAVAARRLAYRRAVARRRAQVQEGAEGGGLEMIEEPPLDMEQVNQQSLRLSKLILVLSFSAILYAIWADLLTVLSYLNTVTVWTIHPTDAATGTPTDISVADVLIALATVGLTSVMARNLPGLLEVMVLSRLSLKPGTAYAATSLLSYVIVAGGFVYALGSLGVSWSKLQWLVAALGVGLGFGLQEIFANFISGLIILFERPIRIGDTITLGELHGVVSRIRIRATTVTDFDRKEIIIPNKTFVTDRLINWSLSDNITRVVLKFGVSHGADLDQVHRLLMTACTDNPRVLKDPEPLVFCMAYGVNAFDFEVRVHVSDLGDRLPVTDELNRTVDRTFREAGIRIAFQQMDVWLHSRDGQARCVDSKGADDGAPAST